MQHDELLSLATNLDVEADIMENAAVGQSLKQVMEVAEGLARSWSGSALGYHSLVYYRDFQRPPAGARFSGEWGLMESWPIEGTVGEWVQYAYDDVISHIYQVSGRADLTDAERKADHATKVFQDTKPEILSIISTFLGARPDAFIEDLKRKMEEISPPNSDGMLRAQMPNGQFYSRDTTALTGGVRSAPHQAVIARLAVINGAGQACRDLGRLARQAGSHMGRIESQQRRKATVGTNVFIGHGRSAAWREVKDFIHDRLRLPYDEFNRVPVAGLTNITRLSEMLDSAAVAFLILTAEDEQTDGSYRARMNVIHEVGLFQGRLGFSKAIVLLEEGCDQFSNIEGLGQIRFPEGRISACFDEVRRVLEREGLVGG